MTAMTHTAPTIGATPLQDLSLIAGRPCTGCGGRCQAREAVWSIALGFKDASRCLPCLSRGLGRDAGELRTQLGEYVRRRECYATAWAEAERLDGTATMSDGWLQGHTPADAGGDGMSDEHAWDAGAIGCGELALALRIKLAALPPGSVIRVTATDPAAPEDIPAWCRLTGHTLVSKSPPVYCIRRKGV